MKNSQIYEDIKLYDDRQPNDNPSDDKQSDGQKSDDHYRSDDKKLNSKQPAGKCRTVISVKMNSHSDKNDLNCKAIDYKEVRLKAFPKCIQIVNIEGCKQSAERQYSYQKMLSKICVVCGI